MRFLLLSAFLAVWSFVFAQQTTIPTDNLLLGHQQFPTTIYGHTADNAGNQYYTGIFRGQLTVNNQVLTSGGGLEDIFWVKTNAAGQVVRFKTFGTADTEGSIFDGMAMGANGRLLFALRTTQTLSLGSSSVVPYSHPSGYNFAYGLACTDTAGNMLWSRRTNIVVQKIYFNNNLYHVFGSVSATSPAIRYDDAVVLDSTGRNGVVHLIIDGNGNLLGVKPILSRGNNQSVALFNASFFSDNTMFLHLQAMGDTHFTAGNKVVFLPSVSSPYQVFLRTDTAYGRINSKVLNSQRHTLSIAGIQHVAACVGAADSVYTIFSYESNGLPFSFDGFNQGPRQNTLFVLDTALNVKRSALLGSSLVGTSTNTFKRRVQFRNMLFQNGSLFINGVYLGTNESPLSAIPVKDTLMEVLPGLRTTIDQNGPSKSFIAKMHPSLGNTALTWYGDHSNYEAPTAPLTFFQNAGLSRLAFAQSQLGDNTWNPWLIDENLTVLTGSMRKGVDGPETARLIQFFSDGSRVILGQARGKTALDSNGNFITNSRRTDVFIVRLRANNSVAWFKRFHSTLASSDIRGLEIRDGKAYFLINYFNSQNDSNYIRADNNIYTTRTGASLMGSIDTAGTLNVLNLSNPSIRTALLMNFSFFSNGDLAVVTDLNPFSYQSFPLSSGPSILRLNAATGALLQARKFSSSAMVNFYTLKIDKNDKLYLSGSIFTTQAVKLFLHNGTTWTDSLQIQAGMQPQGTVVRMDWNRFQWLGNTSGGVFMRQNEDMALVEGKIVLGLFSNHGNQPAFWNGHPIHSGYSTPSFTLLRLNENGSIAQQKVIQNFSPNSMHSGTTGNLHLSGASRAALNLDTIQIGFAGGFDALGVVFDSALVAKRSFRVASPYAETMWDMAIHQDSLVALAYSAQTTAQVYLNRVANTTAAGDLEEDAYLGTLTIRGNVITALPNRPVSALFSINITPNPIIDRTLHITASAPEPLTTTVMIYHNSGAIVASTTLRLQRGMQRYAVTLPPTLAKGTYQVIVSNKKGTANQSVLIL